MSPRRPVRRSRSPLRYLRRLWCAGDARGFARALRSPERISAARAVVDGPLVVLQLRRRGLRPFVASMPEAPAGPADEVRRLSHAVDAGLAVLPMAFTCLRRSVVLLREVERCGLGASLHLGVRRGDGGMEAHAWVQVGDVVVNDDASVRERYAALSLSDADLAGLTFR